MTTTRRPPRRPKPAGAAELITEYGRRLLAAGDPLDAEMLAAALLAQPAREGVHTDLGEALVSALLDTAAGMPTAEAAAVLRAVAAVAPARYRREAVTALGTVTTAGYYPPEWMGQLGRAVPCEAWRRYDVFEDTDTVVVTFKYGEAAHILLVQVDRCREPTVLTVLVSRDVAEAQAFLTTQDPLTRVEPVGLAEARSRIEAALANESDVPPGDLLNDSDLISLPLAQARVRRLPAEGHPEPAHYGPADRSAAVAGFLASPYAAAAGDEKAARFWAEVFAGYSACVPGDPPERIGPLKLTHILLSYVPATFALTGTQRAGLPAAVTAWTRWAAEQRRLDEPAQAALDERVRQLLADFESTYDAPDVAQVRGYLADLAEVTTDAAVLAEALTRRALAVPLPEERTPERTRQLDATDPAARREIIEREYAECEPPDGMSRAAFVAAVVAIGEQLWRDDPPTRWAQARALIDQGASGHDILHELAVTPLSTEAR